MLIRNSALYMVARLLPGLFSLATTAVLTRLLDPQEYGLYGLALVIMMFGSTVAFDWLGLAFLRFYQGRRDDPRLSATFVSIFVALVAISAGALALALLAGLVPAHLISAAVLGLVMVWALSWFELVSRIAVAEFQPIQYMKMNLGRSFLIFAGAVAAAWLTGNALWTAAATAFGMFLGAFFGNVPIPRPSWRLFDRDLSRDVLVFGIPMAASMALSTLTDSGTRFILVHLDSARALGLFTAASILVQNTLGVMGTGIASAGYSLVVRDVERGDHAAARRQLLANGSLLLAVLAPASMGIALTGDSIATSLVGSKFEVGVAPLMPWMALSSFLGGMTSCYFDQAFQLGKRPHLKIWSAGITGVLSIGLSIYLIPFYGPLGAALALFAASTFTNVYSIIVGRYAYGVPLPIAGGLRVGICCVIMTLAVVGLPNSGWTGLLLRAVVGVIAYALSAIAVNLLDCRDHAVRLATRAAPALVSFFQRVALKL